MVTIAISRFTPDGIKVQHVDVPEDAIGVSLTDGEASISWDKASGDVEVSGATIRAHAGGRTIDAESLIIDTREHPDG